MALFDARGARYHFEVPGSRVLPKIGANARPGVDCAVWLPGRLAADEEGVHGTLITASDGGCVFVWNGLRGLLHGGFMACSNNLGLEAITSMVVDSAEATLFTADSLGHLKMWDIRHYCFFDTHAEGSDRFDSTPRLTRYWRAHVHPITSVLLAERNGAVITGSVDRSVRVWSLRGDIVGTLDDESSWILAEIAPVAGQRTAPPTRASQSTPAGPAAGGGVAPSSEPAALHAHPTLPRIGRGDEPEDGGYEADADVDGPGTYLHALREGVALGKNFLHKRKALRAARELERSRYVGLAVDRVLPTDSALCHPYQALRCRDLAPIVPRREPSASVRARRRVLALEVAGAGGGGGGARGNLRFRTRPGGYAPRLLPALRDRAGGGGA